jgi:hypothetical protein
MAKGIIVVDMPKSCCDCRLYDYDMDECVLCNREVPYTRPDWCPISPMPEKAYVREYDRCKSVYDLSDRSRCIGWNACIDAIGGGEDV